MEDYLQQLRSIACSLRAIGKPLTDDDLVTQALQGLPSSYRTFVSGLNATGSLPTFIALRPLLLTEEAHISTISSEESNHNSALLVTTHGQTNSAASSPHGQQPAKGHSHGRGRGRNNKGQYANNIPQSFAAMNLEKVHPTIWYPDSGASAHMTNNPSTLTSHTPYSGSSQVMVGDGTLLSINSTGSSILPTTSKPLVLKNVLYVPSLAKNLLSIQRLCADNNCFIQFTDSDFFVKDKKNNTTLLCCNNTGSLYPICIVSSRSSNFGLFASVVPASTWHQRLGHPGHQSLRSQTN
ncbi:hypothetical protein KY290_010326 [Solanum tuberosum]|uniref:Retrovirus-related Pol polyprotein from transposon TNT 1-94-like beta-barrel domain-containing protein n=1 Tax=Solanum tuberosum TaxID=4113 RepID=A0ABQ7VZM1_SOLTU|nr:hypothetical protein KY290_010326 [Solanum tuberosum]